MKPSVSPNQRREFRPAVVPHPTVTAQPHGLVRGKVVDRVGEARVYAGTKVEHVAGRCQWSMRRPAAISAFGFAFWPFPRSERTARPILR